MIEDRKYFRIKRSLIRDVALGKITKDGLYLASIMLDGVQYDTGTSVFSFQEAARLLGYGRKKAKNIMESLRRAEYIDFNSAHGKHNFEVKLLFYYPVDPGKTSEKEQVETIEEQAQEHAKINVDKVNIQNGNKLGNKSVGSNTKQCKGIKTNEMEDNEHLSFFNIPVPKQLILKYGYKNVVWKIQFLTPQYANKLPENPIGLLTEALKKEYAPTDKFFAQEKQECLGQDKTRANTGLTGLSDIYKGERFQ